MEVFACFRGAFVFPRLPGCLKGSAGSLSHVAQYTPSRSKHTQPTCPQRSGTDDGVPQRVRWVGSFQDIFFHPAALLTVVI